MIIELIIKAIISLLQTIMSVLPNLPAVPVAISSAGGWISDQIIGVVSLLRQLYGTTLLAALVLVGGSLLIFKTTYSFIMWVIRKIPVLNIS
jgi:hypothetical protein